NGRVAGHIDRVVFAEVVRMAFRLDLRRALQADEARLAILRLEPQRRITLIQNNAAVMEVARGRSAGLDRGGAPFSGRRVANDAALCGNWLDVHRFWKSYR